MLKGFVFVLCCFCVGFGNNIELIKNHIQKEYESFYKHNKIKISSIALELSPKTQIAQIKLKDIMLEHKNFLSKGRVRINFVFNDKDYTHLIGYKVEAKLEAIFAQVGIKKSQEITNQEIVIKPILLSDLKGVPISQNDLNTISAKVFIPQETLISTQQVQLKILIRKGESFLATYKEGNIIIQITLIAKENGVKNAIIEAFNPETKKVVRIRVLANATGEIL